MRVGAITKSQIVAALLLPVILPLLAVLYLVVLTLQGRPFLFTSERMRDPDTSFRLYKIRTMQVTPGGTESAFGGHEKGRVTRLGLVLRRSRLDELPQIFNVLRGDMNFIGPRPPLRAHVIAAPRRYGRVLGAMRPGITGLSTVMVHRREDRLMSPCRSAAEAEAVYYRHCLPVKLRLDMIYAERRSLGLDILILWRTLSRLLPSGRGGAAARPTVRRARPTPCEAELPVAA